MTETRFSSLAEVRSAIDRLDLELLHLLSRRATCVTAAGEFKSSETEVRAPDRLDRMLRERRQWAEAEGLDPSFVEALFRSITSYFISQELRQWRGGTAPSAYAMDLSRTERSHVDGSDAPGAGDG